MSNVKRFEEFIKLGIIKKQSPNRLRAEFLIKESEKDYNYILGLIKIGGITDESANSLIRLFYDVLMELIRAKMLLDGYNASGTGAHEAEVSYMRILGFSEKEVQFMDQMRYFRNGMLYYGTILDKEYAQIVYDFAQKLYIKLNELIK